MFFPKSSSVDFYSFSKKFINRRDVKPLLLCSLSFLSLPPRPPLSLSVPCKGLVSPTCSMVTLGGGPQGQLSLDTSYVRSCGCQGEGTRTGGGTHSMSSWPAACRDPWAAASVSVGPTPRPGSVSFHLALGQQEASCPSKSVSRHGKSGMQRALERSYFHPWLCSWGN